MVACRTGPDWGSNPRPRCVPRVGAQPRVLQLAGRRPAHWAAPARAPVRFRAKAAGVARHTTVPRPRCGGRPSALRWTPARVFEAISPSHSVVVRVLGAPAARTVFRSPCSRAAGAQGKLSACLSGWFGIRVGGLGATRHDRMCVRLQTRRGICLRVSPPGSRAAAPGSACEADRASGWAAPVLSKSSRNVLPGPRSSGPSRPCVPVTLAPEGPGLQVLLAWPQWG